MEPGPKSSGLTTDVTLNARGSRVHTGIRIRARFWFLEEDRKQERKVRVELRAGAPAPHFGVRVLVGGTVGLETLWQVWRRGGCVERTSRWEQAWRGAAAPWE